MPPREWWATKSPEERRALTQAAHDATRKWWATANKKEKEARLNALRIGKRGSHLSETTKKTLSDRQKSWWDKIPVDQRKKSDITRAKMSKTRKDWMATFTKEDWRQYTKQRIKHMAEMLRLRPTKHEKLLMKELRSAGITYRSQVIFSLFIVDIYLPEHRVVIECDGPSHGLANTKAKDQKRDVELQKLGLMVVRLSNTSIESNPPAVVKALLKTIVSRDVARSRPGKHSM